MERWLKEAMSLLDQGERERVRLTLIRRGARPLSRLDATLFAEVASRCGLAHLALRALRRIVIPPEGQSSEGTSAERAEYARALVASGSVAEGIHALQGVSFTEYPKALLYLAEAFLCEYRSGEVIALLQRRLSRVELAPRDRVRAELLLAEGLLAEERWVEAGSVLEAVRRDHLEWRDLEGVYERLCGERSLAARSWGEARRRFERSLLRLPAGERSEALRAKKGLIVLEILRGGPTARQSAALTRVSEEALRLCLWEIHRECDVLGAILYQDAAMLGRAYFGSPFPDLRKRMERQLGLSAGAIPECYRWGDGVRSQQGVVLDFTTGRLTGRAGRLPPGSERHRLLGVLLSDFYRPIPTYTVLQRLGPERLSNYRASMARLFATVGRLKAWFRAQELQFEITRTGGGYSLVPRGGNSILIRDFASEPSRYRGEWLSLKDAWGWGRFSVRDAESLLGLPRRTTCRVLASALEKGVLFRVGYARATRYHFRKEGDPRDE